MDDLKNERKEVCRLIMELGHVPITVDYLDNSAKNYDLLLSKIIEECDYFINIVAHKYAPETEYQLAHKKEIPVISLIIDDKARWKASKKEKEPELQEKLEDYKKRLRGGIFESWLNSTELCLKLQSALIQQMNFSPRYGWVRGDQAITPSVANELSRLSTENEQLKRQVKIENGEIIDKLREHMKNAFKVLAMNKITLSFYYASGDNWENSRQFSCLKIFQLLTPELAVGKTTAEVSYFLGAVLNPDLERSVRKDYPVPSNSVKKIMADLSLLKLVKCVNKDDVSGEDEIWEITEYGKELYSAYRMRQLEKPLIENGI